jgi:hypothetical protein
VAHRARRLAHYVAKMLQAIPDARLNTPGAQRAPRAARATAAPA